MADLAFVLLRRPVGPTAGDVLAAAQPYGLQFRAATDHPGDSVSFDLADGVSVVVALMPGPYPGAADVPFGPTSPPPPDVAASPAHLIVTAQGLTGPDRERDTVLARLTAAVVDGVGVAQAVGVMLGHGVVFHRADVFAEVARLCTERQEPLAPEIAVDITAAQESPTRMSFLTHGLHRYGREDIYLTCSIEGQGALGFLLGLSRWFLTDPSVYLPTGDTLGRTAEEKLVVQRVPHPTGSGPEVIRLDLP